MIKKLLFASVLGTAIFSNAQTSVFKEDFVLEILFFVSIGCKTSFIFLRKLPTLRSCVRAEAIVGALFIKTFRKFL